MRQMGQAAPGGNDAFVAEAIGHDVPVVQCVTVLPSQACIQRTGKNVDVVVTTADKGTFLIRERKDHPRSQCPFLRCEVRRIANGASERGAPLRVDPPPVGMADDARRREALEREPAGGTHHPHWRFALQLAGDPLLHSPARVVK